MSAVLMYLLIFSTIDLCPYKFCSSQSLYIFKHCHRQSYVHHLWFWSHNITLDTSDLRFQKMAH